MAHGRDDDAEERLTVHQFAHGSQPPVAERTPPPTDRAATPDDTRWLPPDRTDSPDTMSSSGPSSAARDSDSGSLPRSTNLDAHLVKAGGPVPGEVLFDRYLVERKLGEGGMGTVWLVKHLEFDSPRALKLIVSGIALDENTRARFKREARIMDRLNHPNVVRVYNASLGKESAFIEMEYIQGHSLNTVLKPGVPMPLGQVVHLLDQLCDVLQAANDEGIIHRDLKPSNLIVIDSRTPGRPFLKLLDFGIAKIRSGEADEAITRTGLFLGTPLYSSPEQIQGGTVDSRSDLYSVGVLLYELLTGYRPFSGSLTALICCHTTVPPPPFHAINPRANVPPAVEQVVMACLAKNPAERPQSPRQLAEIFHRALASAGPLADTVNPPSTQGRSRVAALASTWPMEADTATTYEDTARDARDAAATPWPKTVPDHSKSVVGAPASRSHAVLLALSLLVLVALAAAIAGYAWRSRSGLRMANGSPPVGPGASALNSTMSKAEADRLAASLESWAMKHLERDASEKSVGWPRVLRSADGIKYVRAEGGIYIPEGYRAAGGNDPIDGKPARLVRNDGSAEFVRIRGGRFMMGAMGASSLAPKESVPAHWVRVSTFYMQTTEVTNAEFDRFLSAHPEHYAEWRREFAKLETEVGSTEVAMRHPATKISYDVARSFALKRGGRLPTEAQWEFASRSRGENYDQVFEHIGQFEDRPIKDLANVANLGAAGACTMPAKSYPTDITVQGIMDMAGNVRELCRDEWRWYEDSGYELDPEFLPDQRNKPKVQTVVRGGSFKSDASAAKTTDRQGPLVWDGSDNDIGFRLVIECPEERPAN